MAFDLNNPPGDLEDGDIQLADEEDGPAMEEGGDLLDLNIPPLEGEGSHGGSAAAGDGGVEDVVVGTDTGLPDLNMYPDLEHEDNLASGPHEYFLLQ